MFKPTKEQEVCTELAQSNDMLKINACSGSGKTSTLVQIANKLTEKSLYLAFNKNMAEEASGKFPDHVTCMTTHSLAYRSIGHKYRHKLQRPYGKYVNVAWTGKEIATYFKIKDFTISEEQHINNSFIGLIVKDTVKRFESSADEDILSKHIPYSYIKDLERKYEDLDTNYFCNLILDYAEELWNDRIDTKSKVLATHNTYLKLFQLSKPDLSTYGIIYSDESQDVNSVTLDIVMQQKDNCKLIFVGDKYQQIYAWNGSINTLQNLDCKEGKLTKSFRYGQRIANIATAVLNGEMVITGNENVDTIIGTQDVVNYKKPYTMLFRTNMSLITTAVQLLSEGKKKVNVNIDVRDFISSLFSAIALHNGDKKKSETP